MKSIFLTLLIATSPVFADDLVVCEGNPARITVADTSTPNNYHLEISDPEFLAELSLSSRDEVCVLSPEDKGPCVTQALLGHLKSGLYNSPAMTGYMHRDLVVFSEGAGQSKAVLEGNTLTVTIRSFATLADGTVLSWVNGKKQFENCREAKPGIFDRAYLLALLDLSILQD